MFKVAVFLCLILPLALTGVTNEHEYEWVVIPSGVKGGSDDRDLSCYVVGSGNWRKSNFITFDGGNVEGGLIVAEENKLLEQFYPNVNGSVNSANRPVQFLRNLVKSYLITHAHLDHLQGLVIASADDLGPKKIYGINSTLVNIDEHAFNGKLWPNFGPEGLKTYSYIEVNGTTQNVTNTTFSVFGFILNHAYPYQSTAFFLHNSQNDKYLLYVGDTGPDAVENLTITNDPTALNRLLTVWQNAAPIIAHNKLSGLFIESSFVSSRPNNELFGHLTPKWVIAELTTFDQLARQAGSTNGISGLNVVITHVKPDLAGDDVPAIVKSELESTNNLGVRFFFPDQGVPFYISTGVPIREDTPQSQFSGSF